MQGGVVTAARKRAAIELVKREDAELRRTARRFSLCEDDAEDAYQRALEILLLKAPNEKPRDLIRWMKTVVKHEALAVRRYRERMLGGVRGGPGEDELGDPVERLASGRAGPDESAERREDLARSREALRTLKPAELRSLTLLAAGYSYAEISERTGFSHTKVNRSLAEGRERFRRFLDRSETGELCEELLPLLSAFCDGEADPVSAARVREHLRACAACRATMRSYRTAPSTIAALAPALPLSAALLERARELFGHLRSQLPAGGGKAIGAVKATAIGAAAVGGAAACVATGVVPAPLGIGHTQTTEARVERVSARASAAAEATERKLKPQPHPKPKRKSKLAPEPAPAPAPEASEPSPEPVAAAEPVEYAPPPEETAPAPEAPAPEASAPPSGSAAGEFGP
ncbi:MAG TPA: sigma-70 family RNA polymerase sigma factor [Solirubrobacterales bacterium]|nr:sigma-70 family RNA polymerase sigma factor [Solirubrobacterales bacterium]